MCDEAGGCRETTGNFRRASPTSNRAKCLMEPLFGILRLRAVVNPKEEKRFAAGSKRSGF